MVTIPEGLENWKAVCADTLSKAADNGIYGLGTLAGLDGEVIIIDGQAFQYTSTGGVRALEESETDRASPFHASRSHASNMEA
jgi:alpha-acetolactate decarboxylase